MSMTVKLRCLLLASASFFGQVTLSSAQEITVLLVDAGTGHPLANEKVSAQFHIPQVPDLQRLDAITGADGSVKFNLPETTHTGVVIGSENPNLYPCSRTFPLDLTKLHVEGLVSRCSKPTQGCRCKFSKGVSQLKNTPGQLVLFARPVTLWERFLSHIWE